jgi:outer membrane protein
MKTHGRIFLILMTLSMLGAKGQTGADSLKHLTLEKCVQIAWDNNLDVQEGEMQMLAGRIDWNQSKLNLLPNLNGSASSGLNQGRSIDPFTNTYTNQSVSFSSYGLAARLILFSGGTLRNTIAQKSLDYRASNEEWQQIKENLAISVILAYLQVLSNEDLLVQANAQASLSGEQVKRLRIMDSSGAISPYELSDLKGQLANDKLSIITAKNTLETARITLCQLMNMTYSNDLTLQRLDSSKFKQTPTPQTETVVQQALSRLPVVKAADYRYQSAGRNVRALRGLLYPSLSFSADGNTNFSSNARNDILLNYSDVPSDDYVQVNSDRIPLIRKTPNMLSQKIAYGRQLNNNLFTSFALNLSIPLFNNLQARNNIRLAKLQENTFKLRASATRITVQQNVQQAYINLETAKQRQDALNEQVDAFGESFRSAEIRFNAGVINSVDYLTAKNNYDRSKTNLINAQYDRVLKNLVLNYYSGESIFP